MQHSVWLHAVQSWSLDFEKDFRKWHAGKAYIQGQRYSIKHSKQEQSFNFSIWVHPLGAEYLLEYT